jgi:hypothetical protein
MTRNPKINQVLLLVVLGILAGCSSGIPISTSKKYPIEVLYETSRSTAPIPKSAGWKSAAKIP